MKRRTVLKNSAFMVGGILSASAMATLFNSCVAPAEGEVWKPDFLSVDQGKVVTKIADILIPSDDKPGAVEALVPQFIDLYIQKVLTSEEHGMVQAGYKAFEDACKTANGKAFADCSADQQLAFLQAEEKAFIASKEPTFFGFMKEMTYKGFFFSEPGATEVLKYDPSPGNYDGCIPYSEVNGTWASYN